MTEQSTTKVVLSIDIGLHNLALCCLKKSDEHPERTCILLWELIDVFPNDKNSMKRQCEANIKGKNPKQCTREAHWMESGTKQVYCKVHAKDKTNTVSMDMCMSSVGNRLCKNKATHEITSLSQRVCKRHVLEEHEACALKEKSLKELTLQELLWRLQTVFSQWTEQNQTLLKRVTQVVIEKQPIENKKMQVASHCLFYHLLEFYQNRVRITLLPAYHKQHVYDGPAVDCHLKTKYAQRKYVSVQHALWYLANEVDQGQTWQTYLDTNQKKDDLSDALLQGLYILKDKESPTSSFAKKKKGKRRKLHY